MEHMNIVIVGHVDHGKSTLIGRLFADTGSLPKGKLEQVRATCKANAKPFEYAFLLDALKDEQAQGITIDTARSFFKTDKRHYIIIDAPGHIEFLKNMITGAARAEAAMLLIDANEGVQENSRRHAYMMSFLGIKQIVVLVNKMDLVNYDKAVFDRITKEYTAFLKKIDVDPVGFVPISAFEGDNLISSSEKTPWYKGPSVLSTMDGFKKEPDHAEKPFRLPVQDVYKFTESGDDRRIVAGTISSGHIKVGDDVVFLPSNKRSTVKSVEAFNVPTKNEATVDQAIGLTMTTQVYVKPGEILAKVSETLPKVGTTFRVSLFWLGKKPMVSDKKYRLKIGTAKAAVYLKAIDQVLDASELTTEVNKKQINRHDVSECVLQTIKPIAFDVTSENEATGRFVIIDDYEIAGGGIIVEQIEGGESRIVDEVKQRSFSWVKSDISATDREQQFEHKPKWILITGPEETGKRDLAKSLEEDLFKSGKMVYYMGIANVLSGVGADLGVGSDDRVEQLRRLGEIAHTFLDAGLILISTISDLDDSEVEILKVLTEPYQNMVVNVGESLFNRFKVDCSVSEKSSATDGVEQIKKLLTETDVFVDYAI